MDHPRFAQITAPEAVAMSERCIRSRSRRTARHRWSGCLSLIGALLLALPPAVATGQTATPVSPVPSCRDAIRVIARRTTWELTADCTTDGPIQVPDGWTFDGQGHAIRVIDPAGGRFAGGVIERTGGTATVTDVMIDGTGLTAGCTADSRVAGIVFTDASGEISQTTVVDVRRDGGRLCGYGIVAYASGSATRPAVRVGGNTIRNAGDDGLLVQGVAATVTGNTVTGAGHLGIVFQGTGASGAIIDNLRTLGSMASASRRLPR